MNDDHLSSLWKTVGEMTYIELADALARRDWSEVEGMTNPELVQAVQAHDWTSVGDVVGGMEAANAIKAAMKVGTEDDVVDASMSDDDREGRLRRISHAQAQTRRDSLYKYEDGRVGM